MAVVWVILSVVGGLALGICLLRYGLREQSWFWALVGSRLILGVVIPMLILAVFAALFFLPPETALAILVSIAVIIWATLAFLAFKHKEKLVGKALFVLAMVWSGVLSIPLILFCSWEITDAILTALGLSGLGLVSWGFILKQARVAKARKETFYRNVLEDIDSHEQPPW